MSEERFDQTQIAYPGLFRRQFRYRQYTVRLKTKGENTIAEIYDGNTRVHTAGGHHDWDAEHAARQWIDEQDETIPAYDLHT